MELSSSIFKKNLIRKIFSGLIIMGFVISALSSCRIKEESAGPTDCVRSLLEAKRDNDIEKYKRLFYYEPEISLAQTEKGFGVISLTINNIETSKEKTEWFIDTYTSSELAESRGWTNEFISGVIGVIVTYTINYDNNLVPSAEGNLTQTYFVVSDQSDCWKILEAEFPH